MSVCDRLLGAIGDDELTYEQIAEPEQRIDGLAVAELVEAWHVVQTTGYPSMTPSIRAFERYFDGLGMKPDRCVDFIGALLESEPDDAVVAQAAKGKLLGQLVHFRAAESAGRLEALAASPRFRWLMGGIYWMISGQQDEALKARLWALCDRDAFERWAAANTAPEVEATALSLKDLAVHWVKYNSASPVERERLGALDLFDLTHDIPEQALALVVEIIAIEDDPALLGLLAAGLIEDLVPAHETAFLDRLLAEAQRSPKLRELLRDGVWYSGVDAAVVERLRQVIEQ